MGKREEVIAALEFAGAEQRKSGMLEAWFGNCDPHVREVKSSLVFVYLAIALCVWHQVASEANPLLMDQLATVSEHCDNEQHV